MILLFVEDILFISKIRTQAQAVGVSTFVVPPNVEDITSLFLSQSYQKIFIDLNIQKRDPFAVIRLLKGETISKTIPVVAFFSHVQTELAQKATEAGCDMVMPRSQFTMRLPDLLTGVF